jgi:hypothetical protein
MFSYFHNHLVTFAMLSYYFYMNVFEYKDYKKFVQEWLKEHPKGGRGQLKKNGRSPSCFHHLVKPSI